MVDAPPPENPLDYAPQPAEAHDPAARGPVLLSSVFLSRLHLAHLLPDLFQRRLCRDGQGQGPELARDRAPLRPAPDPAHHHHQLRPAADRPVDGRAHLGDRLQLAGPGTDDCSGRSACTTTPVIVGSTVIFAYCWRSLCSCLNFVYALVDPRVKIGGRRQASHESLETQLSQNCCAIPPPLPAWCSSCAACPAVRSTP